MVVTFSYYYQLTANLRTNSRTSSSPDPAPTLNFLSSTVVCRSVSISWTACGCTSCRCLSACSFSVRMWSISEATNAGLTSADWTDSSAVDRTCSASCCENDASQRQDQARRPT